MIREKMKTALRDMHESLGDAGTEALIIDMVEKGELVVSDFSLQEIWHAFERDEFGMVKAYSEAVSSDMFPKITGVMINSTLIAAYKGVVTIGDKLVRTEQSNMEIETYAGFNATEMPEEVQQGAPYKDSGIGEKFV